MRLVLSRKGFDSSCGGMASPILPDGRLLPLPIPSRRDGDTFEDAAFPDDIDLDRLLADLSGGRHRAKNTVHLDPDLARPVHRRRDGWRPTFGQWFSAQGHLQARGVGPGDVFLFFGWFREVGMRAGCWRYVPGSPDLQVIFGWLEVERVLPIGTAREHCLRRHPWILDHPHVATPADGEDDRNALYLARPHSRFSTAAPHGGGRFTRFSDRLRLTRPGGPRSVWRLPRWFLPGPGCQPLSYHGDPSRWKRVGRSVVLRSVARGQEFVLDCEGRAQARPWIEAVIQAGRAVGGAASGPHPHAHI